MARCCGSSGTCACKVEAGRQVTITGTGTAQDPFVIAADTSLAVENTKTFDLGLFGNGTLESPWVLTLGYGPDAQLTDLPDVNAEAPTNGQILAWNAAQEQWVASPPAVVPAGSVITGNGVTGDGSTGNALRAVGDAARYISVTASGIGLSTFGLASLIRPFSTTAARDAAAATVAPHEGSMSIIDGRIDYYDGTDWLPVVPDIGLDVQPGQLLSLSGGYAGGPTTKFIKQLATTTDGTGAYVVLSTADLTGYSGVLSVTITPTGTSGWTTVVQGVGGTIAGTCFRLDDGTVRAGFSLTAVVEALLY